MITLKIKNDDMESLYLSNKDIFYRIAFLHGCTTDDAIGIMNNTLLSIGSNKKIYKKAADSKISFLRELDALCMDFYNRKLRKPIKPEDLKKMRLPYEMTDTLVDILHLPPDCKTPFVCHISENHTIDEIAKITNHSKFYINFQLKRADKKLAKYGKEELLAALNSIKISDNTHQRILDKFFVACDGKEFSPHQGFKRFRRKFDLLVPVITIGIIALFILSYIAVTFHWFGYGL